MASEADQGERSEEATQQRREDYRKRGQVAQTRELSSVLLLFSALLLMFVMSRFFFQQIWDIFHLAFGPSLVDMVRGGDYRQILGSVFQKALFILLPILGLFWVMGFVSTIVQVGFIYNEEALEIRWDRLNPI